MMARSRLDALASTLLRLGVVRRSPLPVVHRTTRKGRFHQGMRDAYPAVAWARSQAIRRRTIGGDRRSCSIRRLRWSRLASENLAASGVDIASRQDLAHEIGRWRNAILDRNLQAFTK